MREALFLFGVVLDAAMKGDYFDQLDQARREIVCRALIETNGNRAQAGRLLGLGSQNTILRWEKRLGIPKSFGRVLSNHRGGYLRDLGKRRRK